MRIYGRMGYCSVYFGSVIYISSKIHCVICQKKIKLITFFMVRGIILKLTRVYFQCQKISAYLEVV